MEDYNYNSLANQLLENGIISSNEGNYELNYSTKNIFEKEEENNTIEQEAKENPPILPIKEKSSHKRLNEYDSTLIKNSSNPVKNNDEHLSIIKRFLEFKKTMLNKGKLGFLEYLEYRFFPRLYRAKLVKEAMNKLHSLNINTDELLDKTIPYGENESRYEDLVKYLNCANELNTRLQKKF